MAKPNPEKLINANIYMDDVNFIGKAKEVDLPKVSIKVTEHETLGSVGVLELFQGVEKMECKIKWAFYDRDALMKFTPTKAVKLTARAAQHVYEAGSASRVRQVRAVMIGRPKGFEPATIKPGEGEGDTTFAVDYYKLTIDDEDIIEIDIPNYILKVGEEDVYADVRSALGI